MLKKDKNQTRIEKSKLLTLISAIMLAGSFIITLLVFIMTGISGWAGSDVFSLSMLPYLIAFVFSGGAFFLGLLSTKAAREDEEKEILLNRKKNVQSTFEGMEDVRFTAGRALANYKKYAPYVLAVLALVFLAFFLFLMKHMWGLRIAKPVPVNATVSAFTASLFMCISIFAGMFCVGQSSEREFRWLRPVGGWLATAAFISLLAMLSALFAKFGKAWIDVYFAWTAFVILIFLAAELLISFVIEFYRPRGSAEAERPIFESRLLALVLEPGGVMRNVADTLDYQFGFKVSKTWIYTLIERSLVPLLLLWMITLWLLTCISEVGPTEVGMRERFGRLVNKEPLSSGVYFKLPYPFENISRFKVHEIHEVVVGPGTKDLKGNEIRPDVVLWTKSHYAKEAAYLVASDKKFASSDNREVPVSQLGASMPVQYKIRVSQLIDYAYRNKDTEKILKDIGEQVATKYLASVDLLKVMSSERYKLIDGLRELLQKAADEEHLGIDIIYVNLHDAHPPVEKVSPAFQDVIGAMEDQHTAVLAAQSYEKTIIPDAEAQALNLVCDAEAYKINIVKVAKAESDRFNQQLASYRQMPGMFKLRTYLDFLENDCKGIRKYIVPAGIPYSVYEINMEEKARLDLLDANIGEVSK